jgi:hypothetical protein
MGRRLSLISTFIFYAAVLGSATFMGGCNGPASLAPATRSGPNSDVTITNERAAARVMLLPNCVAVPNPAVREPEKALPVAALLVAAAPIIADFVYGAVKGYLERSKQDLTANYTASGSGVIFDRNQLLANHCLVIARGRFGPRDPGISDSDTEGALKGSHLPKLGLADFPDLYLEAWPPRTRGTTLTGRCPSPPAASQSRHS